MGSILFALFYWENKHYCLFYSSRAADQENSGLSFLFSVSCQYQIGAAGGVIVIVIVRKLIMSQTEHSVGAMSAIPYMDGSNALICYEYHYFVYLFGN